MTAPVREQTQTAYFEGIEAPQVTLNSVTAGRLMVLQILDWGSNTRSISSIEDSQSNSWTQVAYSGAQARRSVIAWAIAGSSGNVTITVTFSGSETGELVASEVSGHDSGSPFDTADNFDNASGTTHYCADTGEIDTQDNVIVFCAGAAYLSGTITIPDGHDSLYVNPTGYGFASCLESDSALTDYRGQWTCTTARTTYCAIAAFKASGFTGRTGDCVQVLPRWWA